MTVVSPERTHGLRREFAIADLHRAARELAHCGRSTNSLHERQHWLLRNPQCRKRWVLTASLSQRGAFVAIPFPNIYFLDRRCVEHLTRNKSLNEVGFSLSPERLSQLGCFLSSEEHASYTYTDQRSTKKTEYG